MYFLERGLFFNSGIKRVISTEKLISNDSRTRIHDRLIIFRMQKERKKCYILRCILDVYSVCNLFRVSVSMCVSNSFSACCVSSSSMSLAGWSSSSRSLMLSCHSVYLWLKIFENYPVTGNSFRNSFQMAQVIDIYIYLYVYRSLS